MVYGGFLSLTHSHLHHYWHFPTMVGFCHGGNMLDNHHHNSMISITTTRWSASLIMMMICSTQANTTQATPARIRMAASSGKIFLNYLYRHFCENLNQNLKTAVQTHRLHQWMIQSFKIFEDILLSRWKCSFLSLSVISFSWTLNTKCMKAKMTKRSDAKIYGSSHVSESFSKGCFQIMLLLNLF